jgi:HlyD family secretion protein
MNNKTGILLGFITTILMTSCGKPTQETTPIRKDVIETVFASGVLEAKGTYQLTAQSDGYLTVLNFDEGDLVKQGMVLAVVENQESGFNTESANALYNIAQNNTQSNAPALMQAKNAIVIAKQKMEQDALQEQRYKKLLESNSIAKIDYENMALAYQTSKTNYETALESYKKLQVDAEQQLITNKATKEINAVLKGKNQIKAVVSGKVYKKFKQQGDFVRKGDAIATIGDANTIYAKVNVDESSISKIRVGQMATIQLNTHKDKSYRGKVAEIYHSFDEATQSFVCKITFSEPLDFHIINTQLQTNIVIDTQKNALIIPRNYLDFGDYVSVKSEKEALKVKVTTNFVSSEWVQILSGIDEKTVLITENIASNNMKTSEAGAQMLKQ